MSRSAAHDARNAFLRDNSSDNELGRQLSVPTGEVVKKISRELGVTLKTEDIPNSDGGRLHFLGNSSAEKVILYFHGGGYAFSAFEGHVKFMIHSQEKLAAQGSTVLVAFLEYGLTRAKKYPTQLTQATEGLRYVLSKGYRPSNVVIGGDSAGGNLTLGLASVLTHPCPGIEPLAIPEKLRGMLLISPWVSFETSSASYEMNKGFDVFTAESMQELARDFVLDEERNNWTEPIRADVDWWQNLPAEQVLNVFGSHEVFRDGDKQLGDTLKQAGVAIKSVECPSQVHVDCILDAQTGFEAGPMSTEIWQWLGTVL
ncbi:hypothetical protein ACEPPN_019499 [Leptodophora sp. 'Broadleaf-Isolate-01']